MKNLRFVLVFVVLALFTSQSHAQFRVKSDGNLQYAWNSGAALWIGLSDATYQKGKWGIEHFNNGLNIWQPWPNSGYANYRLFLQDGTGYVGISEGSPSYRLDVNGPVRATQYLTRSDKRFKEDITPIKSGSDMLKQLQGFNYKMKDPSLFNSNKKASTDELSSKPDKMNELELENSRKSNYVATKKYGFIAQEIQKVLPELVSEDVEGYLSIDYMAFIPILVEGFKEQLAVTEALRVELDELKAANQKLNSVSSSAEIGSGAKLFQNSPNPFKDVTSIKYYVPEEASKIEMLVFDMNGTFLRSYSTLKSGNGSVEINGGEYHAGMYMYSLIVNGEEVSTKKMILTN